MTAFGLAARSIGLTRALEVAVIQPPAFTVAYRGAMTDGSASQPDQSYLGQTLAGLTGGLSLTFLRAAVADRCCRARPSRRPNYEHDIAPILHQHCAICHHPNGVAPFALTNFSVVKELGDRHPARSVVRQDAALARRSGIRPALPTIFPCRAT